MAIMNMGASMQMQVDMYAGGGLMAIVGHYADQAASQSYLSTHNISNAEALYGLDIVAAALFRKKLRGHAAGIVDASVAYSTGALVDRFLKGRFTTTTPASSERSESGSTVTGWEVDDPSLGAGWGGQSQPAVSGAPSYDSGAPSYDSGADYGEESGTGFGVN